MTRPVLPRSLSDEQIEDLLGDLIEAWGAASARDPSRPFVARILRAHGLSIVRRPKGRR